MDVNFYNFSKKSNSTKIPSVEVPLELSCTLKAGCGVFSPVLQIRSTGTGNTPVSYNYCYIEDFNRYYFVSEWTYLEGVWQCSLTEDVLASNKTAIGTSTCYVTRCADSDEYDGSIKDSRYPTYGGSTLSENTSGTLFDSGHYIIGVYGGDNNSISIGPITFYVFDETNLQKFSQYLYSDGFYNLTQTDVEKALFDPIKYIACAYWVPIAAPASGTGLPVIFGWYEGPIGTGENPPFTCSRLSSPVKNDISATITVPKHPQAATRGSYLNLAPYSRYDLYAGPFGTIPLDSTDLASVSTLTLKIATMDYTTGYARLLVNTSGGKTIAERIEQIAVPVPLAQLSQNLVGAAGAVVSGIGSTITGALTGGVAGAVAGAVSGIASTAENLLPQFSKSGSIGTRCDIYTPFITGKFLNLVAENLDHTGRPCCKELQINTLSGYIEVLDGDLDIAVLDEEYAIIKNSLESGFFYE